MVSAKKGNTLANYPEALSQNNPRTSVLIKKLLCAPEQYYQTKSWLENIIQQLASAFPEHLKNITACKIRINGTIEWCTSLKSDFCLCQEIAKSDCCQQWMSGILGKQDIGRPIYSGEKHAIGVILYSDDATARAMVLQFHEDVSIDLDILEELELYFPIISLQLYNYLLRADRNLLEKILLEAGDSVELTNEHAVIEYVNPAFEKITGYTLEQAQGKAVKDLIRSPLLDNQFFNDIQKMLDKGQTWKGIIHSRRKDGESWVAQSIIIPITNAKGQVVKHLAIKQDITKQYQEQEKLKESEKRYRGIMDSAFDGVVIHDLEGKICQVNRAVCNSLGYNEAELLSMQVNEIEVGIEQADLNNIWDLLKKHDQVLEGRHRRKDGSEFPIEVRLSCLVMDGEKLIIAMIRDISEAKEYEQKLIYKANYDDLTQLPNRNYGMKYLQTALENAKKYHHDVAVFFLDLDNFKQVNDTLGHFSGDQLLINVSKRLKNLTREKDFVARLSGDEFMIVMVDLENGEKEHMIERLQLVFAQPFHIDNEIIHISASIGVSRFPQDGDKSDILIRNADLAMYQSKSSGRGGYRNFVPEMVTSALHDLQFENAFRKALMNEEFDLHFQPIVDSQDGSLISFEALLRWTNEDLGQVNPAQIIEFAEQIGLGEQLSVWILAKVCQIANLCRDKNQTFVTISVNISAQQMNQPSFITDMRSVLKQYRFDPKQLIIEITESTLLLGKEEVQMQLNELRQLGMAIAIDDFGVGYSSFSYLKDFPFSSLKIDKSFIKHLVEDKSYTNLVNSMINMAHCMDLKIVAEGVETQEQADLLRQLGCDYLQGWHIAKAMPYQQISKWL